MNKFDPIIHENPDKTITNFKKREQSIAHAKFEPIIHENPDKTITNLKKREQS